MNKTHVQETVDDTDGAKASEGLLNQIVYLAEEIGQPCVVCMRIRISRDDALKLLSCSLVASIILESPDAVLEAEHEGRIGHFLWGRSSDIKWPDTRARHLVYVGKWNEFGLRSVLASLRAGVSKVHIISGPAPASTHLLAFVAVDKVIRSIIYRFFWSYVFRATNRYKSNKWVASALEFITYTLWLRKLEEVRVPLPGTPTEWTRGRIVMVGASLGPGGAERQLSNTICGLYERGWHDVHFLCQLPLKIPNDFFLGPLIKAGVPYSEIERFSGDHQIPEQVNRDLSKCLAKFVHGSDVRIYAREFIMQRPEIVHIWLDDMNVIAGLAALLAGVPRIYLGCRSLRPTNFMFYRPYMFSIYKVLEKHPNVTFLNNSHAGARDYENWLGLQSERVKVIPNGFDFNNLPDDDELAQWRKECHERLAIPKGATVVGVVMRISEEKRPLLWLEIAKYIYQHFPDTYFIVVGNGPMRDKAERIAEANVPGRVHFTGHEPNVYKALAAMDLFLLTSRVEGLPNVLIEAQSVGVPPVAIDVGGAKETMIDGETGWLAKTAVVNDAGGMIVDLISDKQKIQTASKRAREFVREQFCIDKMIDEVLAVYGYDVIEKGSVKNE